MRVFTIHGMKSFHKGPWTIQLIYPEMRIGIDGGWILANTCIRFSRFPEKPDKGWVAGISILGFGLGIGYWSKDIRGGV